MERTAFRSRVRDDPEAGRSGRPQTQLFDRSTSWPIRHEFREVPKSLPVSLPVQSTARVNGEEALSSPPVARAGNGGSRLRDRAFGAQAPDRVRRPRDRLVQCTGPSASAEARRRRSRAALGALAWTAEPIRRHEADAIGAVAFGEPEIAARRSPRSKPVAMVDRVRGRDRSRQQPVFDATVASRDRCST